MVRIARERIADLFALAERESLRPTGNYADRYVHLARRVGTRYNIRLPKEYRELYCRGCSAYWVEGRTVRTRLRSGRRVRTCLACGRSRRVPLFLTPLHRTLPEGPPSATRRRQEILAGVVGGEEEDEPDDDGSEEA
ncbi:MAG: ribonuclease P [Thermoplasmata archaeon]|jgi:ribonuclease P protein subunit RPR2|nr:ribonuclease P [Thermoplasmata archaeon]